MSLLLDALKKAAEDKKNKKPGESSGDTGTAEDINLDLEIQDNPEFPEVDESLAEQRAREHREREQQQQSDSRADDSNPDETTPPPREPQPPLAMEPRPEDEAPVTEAAPVAEAESAGEQPEAAAAEKPREAGGDPDPTPGDKPEGGDSQVEPELSIEEIIRHDQSSQDRDVLKFLINKSNRQSDRIRFRKRLMYGSLATLILLVLGVFSYFKWLAVSERLYTGDNTVRDVVRPAPTPAPPPQQTVPAPKTTQPPPTDSAQPVDRDPQPVAKKPRAAAVEKPEPAAQAAVRPRPVQTQPISIVHKKMVDPTEDDLRRAYAHFNAGEYQPAGALYRKVLAREPKNRDALLGIAAIALKQNRPEAARQKYLYLLQLNPRDSLARAGLSAVEGQMNGDLNESQLKLMLREQPEAGHLYFALGSQYAARSRWAEAQSAFFSAWAADSSNADYAFNLAVSLDHLGKREQAIEYYRKSLLLNSHETGNFSSERVMDRIAVLEGTDE